MEVKVAGAGSGKTTLMSKLITSCVIPKGKVVFCIAFTNAAADNIVDKVKKKLGAVPDNIKISTIHSFLYQEFVRPYYYFLYDKHFEKLSVINLPANEKYRFSKLSELEKDNILHFTKIPEKAKWVVYGKSKDTKSIKLYREEILKRFFSYCSVIFVDEAQDICEDVRIILESLDKVGVRIVLYGDPKQDVKGSGQFREIIEANTNVDYISDCYRCPQKHLNISNTITSKAEWQIADKGNAEGSISIVFESDINTQEFLANGGYGLKFISKKRERFETHDNEKLGNRFETLQFEVSRAMIDKWKGIKSEIEIKRDSFYVTEQMIESYNGSKGELVIAEQYKKGSFNRLDKKRFAQMMDALCVEDIESNNIPIVNTIEIVKGREAERCLFILSPDLAPYLFGDKTDDNKTKHLLYVALTRSLDHLTIMIMKEVENKYTRKKIVEFFAKYI